MSKNLISRVEFEGIEERAKKFFKDVENDIEKHIYVKKDQLIKCLVKDLFSYCADLKKSDQCVNDELLREVQFCTQIFLKSIKKSMEYVPKINRQKAAKKPRINRQQAAITLLNILDKSYMICDDLDTDIKTFACFKRVEINEYDSYSLASQMIKDRKDEFDVMDGKIVCTLNDYDFEEFIMTHLIIR